MRATTRAVRRWLAFLAAHLLRALGSTWRVSESGRNPLEYGSGPQIAAIWHRDLLITAHHYRRRGFAVAVSRSHDGDWISDALVALGYAPPPRGSSSRGGAGALRALTRLVESGRTVSVTVDGPRGPALEVKPGIIALARLTGVPITPVSFAARPCLRFASWDGTLLPLPFARIQCQYGEPVAVPREATPDAEEALRTRLDHQLNEQTHALEASLES